MIVKKKKIDSESPPASDIKNVLSSISNDIIVEDILEPESGYRYSSFSKKDPFAYPRGEITRASESTSVLEEYSVSSLRLIGIWWLSSGESKGLILTPESEGIVVTIGDSVGNKKGKVLEVGRNKLIIREYILSPDGTRQFSDLEMYLQDFDDTVPSKFKVIEKASSKDEDIRKELLDVIEKISKDVTLEDIREGKEEVKINMNKGGK